MIPDVSEALWDLTDAIEFRLVKKEAVDFQSKETLLDSEPFQGTLVPVPPTDLMVKPEGQRAWQWWTLFTIMDLIPGAEVTTGDGKQFKVMSHLDWGSVKAYEMVQMPIPK
jgi:hypothetical protein